LDVDAKLTMDNKPISALSSELSELISNAMEKQKVSIKDLAIGLDISYEHARRIVRGEGIPSKHILRAICKALDIDFTVAERLAVDSRVRKAYGDSVILNLAGKIPSLEPVERIWEQLTPEQQEDAITLMQGWARRNQAKKQAIS
jgi:transcriptional regulator with XRE-family HTH domain